MCSVKEGEVEEHNAAIREETAAGGKKAGSEY
jgi:hypothetical protein